MMGPVDAITYVGDHVISLFGIRVLVQTTWDAAKRKERERILRLIDAEIALHSGDGSYGKGQRFVLRNLKEKLNP